MKLKNKKEDFLGTVGASLLGIILASQGVIRAGEGTVRLVMDLRDLRLKKYFDPTRSFNKL